MANKSKGKTGATDVALAWCYTEIRALQQKSKEQEDRIAALQEKVVLLESQKLKPESVEPEPESQKDVCVQFDSDKPSTTVTNVTQTMCKKLGLKPSQDSTTLLYIVFLTTDRIDEQVNEEKFKFLSKKYQKVVLIALRKMNSVDKMVELVSPKYSGHPVVSLFFYDNLHDKPNAQQFTSLKDHLGISKSTSSFFSSFNFLPQGF